MYVDPSHPRAASLKIRERLVWGVRQGLTSKSGLIAHGRGEAFDYLIGEKTNNFAQKAIEAAAAYLLTSQKPILSINGNTAALVAKDFVKLAQLLDCYIEVNLFHYSQKRAKLIEEYLKKIDPQRVLTRGKKEKMIIPNIASKRKIVIAEGIGSADLIFVPLEDGDRAQALVAFGKIVITVDLNPLSRTAKSATVTIVDNIVRVMPNIITAVKRLKKIPKSGLIKIINDYNNQEILSEALAFISSRLRNHNKTPMSLRGAKRRGNLSIYSSSHTREIPHFSRNDKLK